MEAITSTERLRVAATRDCIIMYTGSNKREPRSVPFTATLAAANDVTDACCAVTCTDGFPAPPIPIFRDASQEYDVPGLNFADMAPVDHFVAQARLVPKSG